MNKAFAFFCLLSISSTVFAAGNSAITGSIVEVEGRATMSFSGKNSNSSFETGSTCIIGKANDDTERDEPGGLKALVLKSKEDVSLVLLIPPLRGHFSSGGSLCPFGSVVSVDSSQIKK